MYELIRVGENSYYFQSPAKIGLFNLGEDRVCLIDSGGDKDAAKRIYQAILAHGWRLYAIYNTHSHADHIGGNRYLQDQCACPVYAPELECAFVKEPLLEPSFLYGACPPEELRHKFLMAQASQPEPLEGRELPEGLSVLDLRGHSFGMKGFRTWDEVVYLADCLFSPQILDKYPLSYLYDVENFLETLKRVAQMSATLFVPSHAEATSDIVPLVQINRDRVMRNAEEILRLCEEPLTLEELLRRVFIHFGMKMSFEQQALCQSTLKAYLSWLKGKGEAEAYIEDSRLLWKKR